MTPRPIFRSICAGYPRFPAGSILFPTFRQSTVLDDDVFSQVVETLLPGPSCDDARDFFSDRLPSAPLTIIFHEYTLKDTFDAIVIDEAQDFEDKWCDCINYFFTNRDERVIYIFYDDNQSIFQARFQAAGGKSAGCKEPGRLYLQTA